MMLSSAREVALAGKKRFHWPNSQSLGESVL